MKPRTLHRAGFTLVELMVAITITGMVAGVLYSISKSATDTFNQQQRTAEMQLRLRFAMEQLRADLSRAGYMATPNSLSDTKVCPSPTAPLQAITIARDATLRVPNDSDNGYIRPVVLRFVGNYASMDEYLVARIDDTTISLQNQTPQWATSVRNADDMSRIFRGGRMLRIMNTNGQMQFVRVVNSMYQPATGTAYPTITVTPRPTLISDGGGGAGGCGITGLGVGSTIAPISMIEYRLAGKQDGTPAQTVPSAYMDPLGHATTYGRVPLFNLARIDLVRREFDLSTTDTTPSFVEERIIGEYAVDLDATIVRDSAPSGGNASALVPLAFGDSAITSIPPHQIRSVTIRLSIRDREQDPTFGWVARTAADPLTRFRVDPTRTGAARVRTLTAEVTLPNVANRNLRGP